MEEKDTKKETRVAEKEAALKPIEEIVTITPTMMDESLDDREVKQDISAIIPSYESIENKAGEQLTSRDEILKTDGSVTIATIDDLGETTLRENFQLPAQIDLKARKEEQARLKQKKKKKEKHKPTKAAKQQQNIVSFVALLVIGGLVAFYFLVVKAPTEEDFIPLTITIELGEKLPKRTSAYVKPGVGTNVDELLYKKDISKVVLEEVGEYEFTITFKGITKSGTIIIEDTTKPVLETKALYITEGASYTASSFVESCRDLSGCSEYAFQDPDTPKKYTSPGVHIVYIVVKDAYGNTTTKQANLFIETEGMVKHYIKNTGFDFKSGYSITEEYKLNFTEYANYSLLYSGIYTRTYTYEDDDKYQAARKTYSGEPNYECIDHERKIVYSESVTMIGSNYTRLNDIAPYLRQEGYKESQ